MSGNFRLEIHEFPTILPVFATFQHWRSTFNLCLHSGQRCLREYVELAVLHHTHHHRFLLHAQPGAGCPVGVSTNCDNDFNVKGFILLPTLMWCDHLCLGTKTNIRYFCFPILPASLEIHMHKLCRKCLQQRCREYIDQFNWILPSAKHTQLIIFQSSGQEPWSFFSSSAYSTHTWWDRTSVFQNREATSLV